MKAKSGLTTGRYMIHSPYWMDDTSELQDAWKKMEVVYSSGRVRAIILGAGAGIYLLQTIELDQREIRRLCMVAPPNSSLTFRMLAKDIDVFLQ